MCVCVYIFNLTYDKNKIYKNAVVFLVNICKYVVWEQGSI